MNLHHGDDGQPLNSLHKLGLLFLGVLSGKTLDLQSIENIESITKDIKKKNKASTSMNIVIDVALYLMDKHPTYSNLSALPNSKNTARQSLKLLYKLVKDNQNK